MAPRRASTRRDSGTNLARVKDYNEAVVLELVRSGGPIGRPAIAVATGLTLQTVSNIVGRLLAAGAVAEKPVSGAGRSRRVLTINPDAGYALGIHLVRRHLAVGVVDLAGTVRGRADTAFGPDEPPDRLLDGLNELVAAALEADNIPRDRLLGAGIGAPGPLDLRRGALLNVLSPPSWSGFPMRSAVEDRLGMGVILDNDATAAAMGERWSGAGAGCDNFIYVYLGTGLGTGLVLRGQAYRGLRGNAGEVSHIQVEPSGPPCECGAHGCLGLYVSPDGLLREAQRVILEAPSPRPIVERARTVDQLVATSEPRLAAVVERAGERLARVVTEMSRVLDPELIVLGGPLVSLVGDVFADALRGGLRALDTLGAPPPRVEVSHIGTDAGVVGAATLVLHDVYAPSARKLSLGEAAGRNREERAA
jgi:predicted NBD/HSP70 family sugar kinase